jgi:hypothetical protein
LWIVLPIIAIGAGEVRAVKVRTVPLVAIEVVVPVDVDVVVAPAEAPPPAAAPGGSHRYTDAPGDRARSNDSTVGGIVDIGIRIYGRPIYRFGIVRGHIDNFRICLFNDNHCPAVNDLILHLLVLV